MKKTKRELTIVTAVKNRSHPLRYTIPTWLAEPGLEKLIIVDWDSDVAVINELDTADIPGWPDPRIRGFDSPNVRMRRL